MNTLTSNLISQFNQIYASGQGADGFTSVTSENAVSDPTAALNQAGLTFPPQNGTFQVEVTNQITGQTTTSTDRRQPQRHGKRHHARQPGSRDQWGRQHVGVGDARAAISRSMPPPTTRFSLPTTRATRWPRWGSTRSSREPMRPTSASIRRWRNNPQLFATAQGGGPSDGSNALALTQFAANPISALNGESLNGYYNSIVTNIGNQASAETTMSTSLNDYSQSLTSQQQQYSGVSLDQEAIQILQYQQSYQAAAKIVTDGRPVVPNPAEYVSGREVAAMTVAPISSGRIPNSLIASQIVDNINTIQDPLNTIEQEVETGQQLFTPGQNPTATAIVLPLQQQLASQTQYQINLTTDQSFLQSTDSALAERLLVHQPGQFAPVERARHHEHPHRKSGAGRPGRHHHPGARQHGQFHVSGAIPVRRERRRRILHSRFLPAGRFCYNGDQASINSNIDSGLVVAQQRQTESPPSGRSQLPSGRTSIRHSRSRRISPISTMAAESRRLDSGDRQQRYARDGNGRLVARPDGRRRPAAHRKRLSARHPDGRHRLRSAAGRPANHAVVRDRRRLRHRRRQNRRRPGHRRARRRHRSPAATSIPN